MFLTQCCLLASGSSRASTSCRESATMSLLESAWPVSEKCWTRNWRSAKHVQLVFAQFARSSLENASMNWSDRLLWISLSVEFFYSVCVMTSQWPGQHTKCFIKALLFLRWGNNSKRSMEELNLSKPLMMKKSSALSRKTALLSLRCALQQLRRETRSVIKLTNKSVKKRSNSSNSKAST